MIVGPITEDFASGLLIADHVRIWPHRQERRDLPGAPTSPAAGNLVGELDRPKAGVHKLTHEVSLIESGHVALRVASGMPAIQDSAARQFQVRQVDVGTVRRVGYKFLPAER
jgi:hypothetical protein